MLAAQTQSASGDERRRADPWTRMANAGYTNSTYLAENIFAFAKSTFEADASFAIDWGRQPADRYPKPDGAPRQSSINQP